jgi:hypothetical protein
MTAAGPLRQLGLDLQLDAETIRGRIYDREDAARLDRPFWGWLGLMSAIEAALGEDAQLARGGRERGS